MPPVDPEPSVVGVVSCVTTVCRFVLASSTSARAFAHACSSSLVGSLASMTAANCEGESLAVALACAVSSAFVTSDEALAVASLVSCA